MNIGCFIVIFTISLLQRSLVTNAQDHPDDLCINAQPFVIGSSTVPIRFNTTIDVGSYPGQVWFKFNGTGGRISIDVNSIPPTLICDEPPYIRVFSGGCDPSTRQYVAGIDVYNVFEPVIFKSTIGTEYHVFVSSPSLDFFVVIYEAPPQGNYDCMSAQSVAIGTSNLSMKFNTTYATTDLDVGDNCPNGRPPDTKGIWFQFIGTGGPIIARASPTSSSKSSCECAVDYNFFFGPPGTSISVFTGGCEPSTRQCVAASTDGCDQFVFNTTVGTTYHVLVRSCYIYSGSVYISIFQPVDRPTKQPVDRQSCGLFGFNFFCPQPGKCGFFRRLLRINGC